MPMGKKDEKSQQTVTRADLVDAVCRQIGLARVEAASLVEIVLDEISSAAQSGENIKLSSFGTFTIKDKRERKGRNPKTGIEAPIAPRKVMTFKASTSLKRRINGGDRVEE